MGSRIRVDLDSETQCFSINLTPLMFGMYLVIVSAAGSESSAPERIATRIIPSTDGVVDVVRLLLEGCLQASAV